MYGNGRCIKDGGDDAQNNPLGNRDDHDTFGMHRCSNRLSFTVVAQRPDPGHNDWYWESRVNLLMDNPAGMGPVCEGYTVAELTEMVRDLPVTMIGTAAFGNRGTRVTYPSKILPNAGGSFDTVGTWKQVADNLGMKFLLYTNSLGLSVFEEHPEWMRRRADGTGYRQRQIYYRMCVLPTPGKDGWLETILLPVVKEIVTKYKPDAIWMDGTGTSMRISAGVTTAKKPGN